ncbi:hypothetical protein L6164_036661 [Bauhinia variegata]|uniref:Uncharacterized protein n=1 Tax=Bauhinia variegata TaxID=167791 RepID=A0ACB9KII0_BAUVA|nr:hypothetical protein L6164_036661 [Bauhinia variegata]
MAITTSDLLINRYLWRFVGFGSSIVGFSCYALSPSFKNLFGEWNLLKIFIYSLVSFMFSCFILFANRWRLTRSSLLKANLCFLVLMVTSVYSFYQDKSEEGKAEKGYGTMLILISCGAFALMSLSLSRQIQLKFEVGMFNFFLGCVMITVMKMNIKVALGAAAFCYVLISIRSYSDSQLENQGDTQYLIIDIDNTSHQQVDTEFPRGTCLFQYDSDLDSVEDSSEDEVFSERVFLSYAGKLRSLRFP